MTYPPGGPPPQGPYGAPPTYGAPQPMGPYGPPPAKSNKTALFVTLGAVGAAVVVVLVLALAGVFSGDDSEGDGDSPQAAVSTTMDALKSGNAKAMLDTLCLADQALADGATPSNSNSTPKVDSYRVGAVHEQSSNRAKVDVTIETTSGKTVDATYATRKESKGWRVCLSDTIAARSSAAASDPAEEPTDDPDESYDPDPGFSPSSGYGDPSSTSPPPSTYGGRYKTPSPGETITIPGGSTVVLPDDLPTAR